MDELKGAIDEKSFRIVVFIDDLDRCLPDKAVELLEAIKLFLDIEGYLFIIGVDREVVKKGISYRYRFFEHREEKEKDNLTISPEDYLDKMIQLPLELPAIEHGKKRRFIEALLGESDDFKEHADIIEAGVGDNPRSLKRFVNVLAFTVRLAETLKDNIINDKVEPKESDAHKELMKKYFIPLLYIKWVIIVFRYPKEHNTIKGNKKRLIELQNAAKGTIDKVKVSGGEKAERKGVSIEVSDTLRKVLAKGEQFPDDDWLIERFIHLTESTVISLKDKAGTVGYQQTYKPGDMVIIPAGEFLYGDDKRKENIESLFEINVYPVTNSQYKKFVGAGGYTNKDILERCWSEEGRRWRKNNNITQPEYRNDEKWNQPDHPVVGVSYYEAEAYARWTEKRLPTEEEWEKAARGTDGREYPWGNGFDKEKCNSRESGSGGTTRVTLYPNGISPYGCYDMAGNVWEWTDSWYDDKNGTERVLRGGSWDFDGDSCQCASCDWFTPDFRYYNIGLRCVRDIK